MNLDFWSNPGAAMYPGMYSQPQGLPGMTGLPGMNPTMNMHPISRMPAPPPAGWLKAVMPANTGPAKNQTPDTLNQMAGILSRGRTIDPANYFAGMPMNPRYAQFAGMGGTGMPQMPGPSGQMGSAFGMGNVTPTYRGQFGTNAGSGLPTVDPGYTGQSKPMPSCCGQ